MTIKEKTDWKKMAKLYKDQHGEDTNKIASLVAQLIKLRGNGCTCHQTPGDEYYCSVHGGEGCLIDLKVKSEMLLEAFGEWIVSQPEAVKDSAVKAFGQRMKNLGETLYNHPINKNKKGHSNEH